MDGSAFDVAGARAAGYTDDEIADYLGNRSGFDVGGARKAGYSSADIVDHLAPPPAPPAKPPEVSDYLKSGAAGALQGTGAIFQGAGELVARGVNAAADTELRAANPFQGAIDWLNNSQTAGAKKAIADTDISGEVLSPSTWSLGKNPSFGGLALQGMNAIGQFAPNLATALITAGASIPTQLAVGATVGGLQALGGASEEERNKFNAMTPDELQASSALYRELIGKGVRPDVAKNAVAEAAALGGGVGNAIPSAAEGAFEDFLVGALTRGRWKIPSLGAGFAGRVAAGTIGGASMGGTEEAVEQAGQNLGSNMAVGGKRPLGEDTLQNFVMGMIAQGAAGAGGGALQHIAKPGEAPAQPHEEPNLVEVNPADVIHTGEPFHLETNQQASARVLAMRDPVAKITSAGSIDDAIAAAQGALDFKPVGAAEIATMKAANLELAPTESAAPVGNEIQPETPNPLAPAAAVEHAEAAQAQRQAQEAEAIPYQPPQPEPLALAPQEPAPAATAAPGIDYTGAIDRAEPLERAASETVEPPRATAPAIAAPRYEDYAGPEGPRLFKSEKGAALFIRVNKLSGYAPRETPQGWVASKPVHQELTLEETPQSPVRNEPAQEAQATAPAAIPGGEGSAGASAAPVAAPGRPAASVSETAQVAPATTAIAQERGAEHGEAEAEAAIAPTKAAALAEVTRAAQAVRTEAASPENIAALDRAQSIAQRAGVGQLDILRAVEGKEPLAPAAESAGGVAGAMRVGAVRTAVQHIIRRVQTPVTVVQSVSDVPFKVSKDAKGAYQDGRVWLIADNLANALDAERTLGRHELVHAGYDKLYGGNRGARESALKALQLRNPRLRELARAWRAQYGQHFVEQATENGMSREAAAYEMVMRSMEESVAYMAEHSEPLRGLRRFLAVIQKGLRAMGLGRVANALEHMTDAEAHAEIGRILKATEEPGQVAPRAGAVPATALRITKDGVRTVGDFVFPETPEYSGNTTGDLATITEKAAASHPRIKALPIRLPAGFSRGQHQGFGLEHMNTEAMADRSRAPRVHTQDVAENFARDVADIARNGNKLYYDERNDRVVLQGKSGYGIVLEEREGKEGAAPFYSVVTMFKPKRADLWGRPVWVGREGFPTTESPKSVAPSPSPGQETTGAKPHTAGVQTERFQFTREAGEKQGPEKTPPAESGAAFAGLTREPGAPAWIEKLSPEMQESLRKAGAWRPQLSVRDRLAEMTADWQKKVRQGMVDQFDPIKSLDYKAYMLARMSKSSAGPLESMLFDGTVYLDKDGAVDVKFEKGGFVGIMQKLLGEHDRFFSWVIANRAERLLAEGKEHNLTAADVKRLKSLADGTMRDGRSRTAVYMQANADLQRYNKSAVDMAVKAGLVDAESRPLWEKDFYIPFYRVMDDDKVNGPIPKKGLVRQYAFKTLKGGAEAIGDPMENILKNWSHLIDASLKNQAARASILAAEKAGVATEAPEETARQMAKAAGKKDAVVFFSDEGVKRFFVVDDPFVLDAVNSLAFTGFSGTGVKIMSTFKHWLTFGTTISPTFRIRNLIRDSLTMIGTNPADYNVLTNVLTGWKATEEGSAVYASMIAGGGVIRFGSMQEDSARNVKRLIDAGVDEATILDSPDKVKGMLTAAYDWWMHVGDRSENINRAALYQQLRDQGKSHLEASYAARDTMDFSMQGTWAAIRFLTQTVPFFNARLQGLYKLGHGAAEDPRRFAYVVGGTALASIMLLLAYKDDKDWKQREDWDRETYWWFKLGDKAFRIPKPFEIGAIGTLAERGVELMATDDLTGKQFVQRMGNVVGQQLSMNPVPQLFMPIIETWANQNTFTNRPIETQGMEALSPSQRIAPGTSATAQLLGKNNVVSPVQIDHLISGYFGWLGMHAVATADLALRPLSGAAAKPAPRINELFVLGDFVHDLPEYQSKYVTRMYDQGKEVQELMADVRNLQKVGAFDKARELLEENPDKVRLAKLYTAAESQEKVVNQQIKAVEIKDMDPDVKRQRLDALYSIRDRIAALTEERARSLKTQ